MVAETLSIGAVATLIGVSPGTVRLWESQGLIAPLRGSDGKRAFSARDLTLLRKVKYLRMVQHLNAAAIRRILETEGQGEQEEVPALASLLDQREAQGRKLRGARQARGMRLREAAAQADLSVSFISAVERGVSGASPTAIARLMEVYETGAPAGDFETDVRAHKIGLGHATTVTPGVHIEWLSGRPGLLEPQYYRVAPGASSTGTYEHRGEEFLFVVKGCFRIVIDEAAYELDAGSSLHFPSHMPHRWENPSSEEEVELVWITTERGLWRRPLRSDITSGGSVDG